MGVLLVALCALAAVCSGAPVRKQSRSENLLVYTLTDPNAVQAYPSYPSYPGVVLQHPVYAQQPGLVVYQQPGVFLQQPGVVQPGLGPGLAKPPPPTAEPGTVVEVTPVVSRRGLDDGVPRLVPIGPGGEYYPPVVVPRAAHPGTYPQPPVLVRPSHPTHPGIPQIPVPPARPAGGDTGDKAPRTPKYGSGEEPGYKETEGSPKRPPIVQMETPEGRSGVSRPDELHTSEDKNMEKIQDGDHHNDGQTDEEPKKEDVKIEEHKDEEHKDEERKDEEHKDEEHKNEDLKIEEHKDEEHKEDEHKDEEPKNEEHKDE